jgi:hypothetical protein
VRPVPVERAPVPVAKAPAPAPRQGNPRLNEAVKVAPAKETPPPPRSRTVEGGGSAYERFDRTVPKKVD